MKKIFISDERVPCPDCDGRGKIVGVVEGVPASVCTKYTVCNRCWPRNADGTQKILNDGTAGTLLLSDIH
jgi:C4-type Zn-finger protein